MTGKEFYTDFFGVKDPKEKGTTINISVWRFAEAYAEALKQGQSLPIDDVVGQSEQLKAFDELFDYAWNLAQHSEELAKLNEIRERF